MPDPRWGNSISGVVVEGTSVDVLINEDLGPEPAAHGVLLCREQLVGSVYENSLAYHAEITARAGVSSVKFLCDWRGQFSVICSAIVVRAIAYKTLAHPDGASWMGTIQYRHSAAVGFGGWHAARPLTYTGEQQIGASFVLAIPPFARRFIPLFGVSLGSEINPQAARLPSPGELSRATVGLTRPGGLSFMLTSKRALSPADLIHGIDIGDASELTLTFPRTMMLTPTFELAL